MCPNFGTPLKSRLQVQFVVSNPLEEQIEGGCSSLDSHQGRIERLGYPLFDLHLLIFDPCSAVRNHGIGHVEFDER